MSLCENFIEEFIQKEVFEILSKKWSTVEMDEQMSARDGPLAISTHLEIGDGTSIMSIEVWHRHDGISIIVNRFNHL